MTFYELLVEWSGWLWPLLANHLWQATLFCLFVFAVCAPLKRAPARVRYSLWLIALMKFVLPCAAVAALIQRAGIDATSLFSSESGGSASGLAISPFLSPVASAPAVSQAIEPVVAPGTGSSTIAYAVSVQEPSYWYVALTFIWIVGCAILFGSWLRRRSLLSAAIRSGRRVSGGRELLILERVRSWLSLRRKVALVISPRIAEPGVWRVFRPVVVLPEGISERLSDTELETVMMHEMVHVERWDNLTGIIQRTVCYLLWFHPLVWLLDKYLLAEREQSCDDTVIKLSGASAIYATSIAKVCRYSIGWTPPGLSSAAGSNLKKRIKRIADAEISRSPSVLHRVLLGTVAAVLLVLSAATGLVNKGAASGGQQDSLAARSLDSSFVAASSEEDRGGVAIFSKGSVSKPSLLSQAQDSSQPVKNFSAASTVVKEQLERIEMAEPGMIAEMNQANQEKPEQRAIVAAPLAARVPATIIPAAATTQSDLSEFVGRYEVDPDRAENFILDITLEHDKLWLKPSHAPKRMLLRSSELGLVDVYSDFRFTVLRGSAGRVIGLRLDSWDNRITARKLSLPSPSLNGGTTFRLKGHASARVVALAGSFNNWNQSQLLFAREGDEWVCRVNLPPGKYEYKFIIDGDWITDPANSKTVQDDRGNVNSLLKTS